MRASENEQRCGITLLDGSDHSHCLASRCCAALGTDLNLASLDESQSSEYCVQWLARELSRQPEAGDLYHAGKALYQSGRYRGAVKLLRLYVDGDGCEMPGHHLLAHALFMCDEKRAAIEQARRVVNCSITMRQNGRSEGAVLRLQTVLTDSILGLTFFFSLSVVRRL